MQLYKQYIEQKLQADCLKIINLVKDHVLVNVEAHIKANMLHFEVPFIEERAFFYKIVGDYYRYAAEATSSSSDRTRD